MGCVGSDCKQFSQYAKPYLRQSLDDSSQPEVVSKAPSKGNKSTSFSNSNNRDKSDIPPFLPSTKIFEQKISNSSDKEKNLVTISDEKKSKDSDNGENRALSIHNDKFFEEISIEKETSGSSNVDYGENSIHKNWDQAQATEVKESSISKLVESEPNYAVMDWRHEAISSSKVVERKKKLDHESDDHPKKEIFEEEEGRLFFSSNKYKRRISDMKPESLAIIVHDENDNLLKVVVDTRGQLPTRLTVTENEVPWIKGSPRFPMDYSTNATDDLITTALSPKVTARTWDSKLQSINKQFAGAARSREKTLIIQELIAKHLRDEVCNQARRSSKRNQKRSYQDARDSKKKIALSNTSLKRHVKNTDLRRVRNTASEPYNSLNSVDITLYNSSPDDPAIAKIEANSAKVLDQPAKFSSVDEQQKNDSAGFKAVNMRSKIRRHTKSSTVSSPVIMNQKRSYHDAMRSRGKIPLGNISLKSQVKIIRRVTSSPSEPNNFPN